jgi:dienelactone hydrolase
MATRYALDPRIKAIVAPDVPPFKAHMDIYGPCHQTLGEKATTGAAYLAIFGDEDYSVDAKLCEKVHGDIAKAGSPVEVMIIPGAGHAWESSRPRKIYDYPYISNCELTFDPQTGASRINGELVKAAPAGASRGERAFARAAIMMDAPQCIKRGYYIGDDKNAQQQSKEKMMSFLKEYL